MKKVQSTAPLCGSLILLCIEIVQKVISVIDAYSSSREGSDLKTPGKSLAMSLDRKILHIPRWIHKRKKRKSKWRICIA